MRKLNSNDYATAGNLSELLFLGLVMVNNIWKPHSTLLVVGGAIIAFTGLIFIARGYNGGFAQWA